MYLQVHCTRPLKGWAALASGEVGMSAVTIIVAVLVWQIYGHLGRVGGNFQIYTLVALVYSYSSLIVLI